MSPWDDVRNRKNLGFVPANHRDWDGPHITIPKSDIDDVLTDAEALLTLVPVLERIANYPFGGHTPPEMRKLASEALATLPEHLTHECVWIDPTNEYVMGGGICLGCGAIRAEAPEQLRREG